MFKIIKALSMCKCFKNIDGNFLVLNPGAFLTTSKDALNEVLQVEDAL